MNPTVTGALLTGALAVSAPAITLSPLSRVSGNGAEIVAYDAAAPKIFVTNGSDQAVDVWDLTDPSNPLPLSSIDITPYGDEPTHVSVQGGIVAVTVVADPKTDPGMVAFFDTDGHPLSAVTVGALPDSLAFSPDGTKVVVANEGEPNNAYTIDPEGTVSVIDISGGVAGLTDAEVKSVGFTQFNNVKKGWFAGRLQRIRISGPNATVAQDLEPEFVCVSPDSTTAFVSLQENNAIAVIDLVSCEVSDLLPLGVKDHSKRGNALDPSNEDGGIFINNWPTFGMYMPDGLACFEKDGELYVLSANEGDAREYIVEDEEGEEIEVWVDETRVKDLVLSKGLTKRYPDLQEDEKLGRLKCTIAPPFATRENWNGDEVFQRIYSYGARSFSIWAVNGRQVYDSGDDIENRVAALRPDVFNASDDDPEPDGRSDDKGPEPEYVAYGEVDGRAYAFVGLERTGGVMAYDVTNPKAPFFVTYVNTREDDLAPEGMQFVSAADSPNGQALLLVAYEASNTTVVFQINP